MSEAILRDEAIEIRGSILDLDSLINRVVYPRKEFMDHDVPGLLVPAIDRCKACTVPADWIPETNAKALYLTRAEALVKLWRKANAEKENEQMEMS